MVRGKFLAFGISLLILGVVLYSVAELPIGDFFSISPVYIPGFIVKDPTLPPLITFTTPDISAVPQQAKYFFETNGTYYLNQSSWLKIIDNKGTMVYSYPVTDFPITVSLSSNTGYVAIFEGITFNSTTLVTITSLFRYAPSTLANYIMPWAILLIVTGFGLFLLSWSYTIFNLRKRKVPKKSVYKEIFNLPRSGRIYYFTIIFAILSFSVMVYFFPFLDGFERVSVTNFSLWVVLSAIIGLLAATYYLFLLRTLSFSVSKGLSYDNISFLTKVIRRLNSLILFGLAVSLFALMAGSFLTYDIIFSFGFNLLLVLVFIFLITSCLFNEVENIDLVIPLKEFIKQYDTNPDETDFKIITVISKSIVTHYKTQNLLISQSALSIGIVEDIVLNKNCDKLKKMLKHVENSADNCGQYMLPLIEDLVARGTVLEQQGVKVLSPSIYSKYLPIVLTLIGTLATVLKLLL